MNKTTPTLSQESIPLSPPSAVSPALQRVLAGDYGVDDLAGLLADGDPERDAALFAAANQVRAEHVGDSVHLRGLVEFSNHCGRTCQYCGLRAANKALQRYRMQPDEIVEAGLRAAALGYGTVVLQSGEDAWYRAEVIAGIVQRIKAQADVAVTLCLGERPREDYALWREAGADRYLLRIETSNRELYAQLHPGMSFDHRLACLGALRELDYQVGSGVLVGLPGQTLEMLARDLLFLRDLPADMVGLGPFIPHPGTPLAQAEAGRVPTVLRMVALTRLLLPDSHVVATTALGSADPLGREKALQAGANVMMPNVTPRAFRALYEIYPDKICTDEEPEHCRGCMAARIASLGRTIATGHGDAPRWLHSQRH
ncbi:MAG: [FeFe] hydrogenase H-cluster radical SAM maturase HydE [Armatimonadetes bacterium]|nr:[FeFe] hydrogenase H-cluster radical SAM maturase HydE [Armatimonadota bacterium]